MIFAKEEVHPEKESGHPARATVLPFRPNLTSVFLHSVEWAPGSDAVGSGASNGRDNRLGFAVDSIPAIFAVTTKPFIIFTSTFFAILGLRSLYACLVGAWSISGISNWALLVLIFIGAKMVLEKWIHLETVWSLVIVAGIIVPPLARRSSGATGGS